MLDACGNVVVLATLSNVIPLVPPVACAALAIPAGGGQELPAAVRFTDMTQPPLAHPAGPPLPVTLKKIQSVEVESLKTSVTGEHSTLPPARPVKGEPFGLLFRTAETLLKPIWYSSGLSLPSGSFPQTSRCPWTLGDVLLKYALSKIPA